MCFASFATYSQYWSKLLLTNFYAKFLFYSWVGRSPGEGNGNSLQYPSLENPMDRGAWRATVHEVKRVGHDLATKPPPPLT